MSVQTNSSPSVTTTQQLAINTTILDQATIHTLALTVILALAIAIRVIDLNVLGYNSDEAVYAGQAAALAQVPILSDIFPVFRAHPLLFQFILALFFRWFGAIDWLGRLISAGVGVATVVLIYQMGCRLYGRSAGLFAALIIALMPYHVVVTRQVLLDGPMMFCATLALYMTARFAQTHHPAWLYAAGASMGLTFLAKETGVLMVGAIYAFLALTPKIRVRLFDVIGSLVVMVLLMVPFPLSVALAGGGGGRKTEQYLVWQLFRRPNHTWDFYPLEVPPAIGIWVVITAVAGLWLLRRYNGWREKLLVLWVLVPALFFQLWPTKGFQYLLPAAASFALLAGRTLAHWPHRGFRWGRWYMPRYLPGVLLAGLTAVSLFGQSWQLIHPLQSNTFLAGSGGVPGGREAGLWIDANVPTGATFMTVGPSMANIVKFYSHRQAFGASVSPNPLHRNPSYDPVLNPDFQIRTGSLQYIVWDSFSAERSSFFSDKVLYYVDKYHGRVVHTQTVTVTTPEGAKVAKPVIIIYEVHP